MNKGRTKLSKAKSYKEIGDFWDAHDLSDFWDQTKKVEFDSSSTVSKNEFNENK